MKRRAFHAGRTGPLAELVAQGLSVPEDEARALVERGAVYLRGRRQRAPAASVEAGTPLMVVLEERGASVLSSGPAPAPLVVLYADRDLLAVDKPAGLPTQPGPGGGPSLLALASGRLEGEAGLVHRLDAGTSGVVVFGATREATSALAAAFRTGTARKQYLAVADPGLADAGTCTWPLARDPSRPGRWRAADRATGLQGLAAETRWQVLARGDDAAAVVLWPRTGRTHQLRAHLAALGAPIAGDRLYGGAPRAAGLDASRPLLHAHALRIPHPRTGRPLVLVAPAPADLDAVLRALGAHVPDAAALEVTGAADGASPR